MQMAVRMYTPKPPSRFQSLAKTFIYLRFVRADERYGWFRKSRGVKPVVRWNMTEKWLWLAHPTRCAISVIGRSV
jgi:hypothetical protein